MSCVSHEPLLLLTPLPPLLLLLLSIPFVSSSQCAGEPPFPVLATCIVFLDHLQNVHIHAMRTKFQIVFLSGSQIRMPCVTQGILILGPDQRPAHWVSSSYELFK